MSERGDFRELLQSAAAGDEAAATALFAPSRERLRRMVELGEPRAVKLAEATTCRASPRTAFRACRDSLFAMSICDNFVSLTCPAEHKAHRPGSRREKQDGALNR